MKKEIENLLIEAISVESVRNVMLSQTTNANYSVFYADFAETDLELETKCENYINKYNSSKGLCVFYGDSNLLERLLAEVYMVWGGKHNNSERVNPIKYLIIY